MNNPLTLFLDTFFSTVRDVIPIIVIIFGFQLFVLRKALNNPKRIFLGFFYVILGLSLFLMGLELALFPLGSSMAEQLTAPDFVGAALKAGGEIDWQAYYWVYLFAAAIGFSTTVAEPH